MFNLAVIGDWDSVYGFGALGLEVYPASDSEEGGKILRRLAERQYAVIYITEALCAGMDPLLEELRGRPLPAVVPIPGITGNTGIGMALVKKSVERAVGSDILE